MRFGLYPVTRGIEAIEHAAEKAELPLPTIQRMERLGLGRSTVNNAERVQAATESAGIEFLGPDKTGEGVFAGVKVSREKSRK